MVASIRGHQGRFDAYTAGEREVWDIITKVTCNMDSNFSRSEYVGNSIPEGDQSISGWSGQIELEVKDASADEFMDAIITNNLNGIGVQNIFFIITETYGNGTTKSYVYSDTQWKISRDQSGLSSKITKRLDFQSSVRTPL